MKYSLLAVDHSDFGDSHWERFHALLVSLRARGLGNPPPSTRRALQARVMGRIRVGDRFREWVIFEGERPVGWVALTPRGRTPDGRGIIVFHFNFEPGLAVASFAPLLASRLSDTMQAEACEVAHALSPEAHLDGLRQAWGGTILSSMVRYRLDREHANRALIE